MIKNIKSKPLRLLYEKDDGSKLSTTSLYKIKLILENDDACDVDYLDYH